MNEGSWGDTGLYPTLFSVDIRSFVPFLIFFVHWDKTLFSIAISFLFLSTIMLYYHISYEDMFRIIRRSLTGKHRYRHNHRYRNMTRNY